MQGKQQKKRRQYRAKGPVISLSSRLKVLQLAFFVIASLLVARLLHLQVLRHGVYEALASGQRELYRDLFPERGDVLVVDKGGTEMPFATNRFLHLVWAEPRRVDDPVRTAQVLSELLDISTEPEVTELEDGTTEEGPSPYDLLLEKLQKEDDPYEPIQRRVDDALAEEIERANLEGIHLLREEFRFYPEGDVSGHVLGFVSADEDGSLSGKYGVEGHHDDVLAGSSGFLFSELDAQGNWISIGARSFADAQDGADLVLTIDRTLQHVACTKLQEAVERHQADSGSVLILNAKTGAITVMCGAPTFDPNVYNEVESISTYNNQTIFGAYEPGSIFKPLVMAAGLDAGAIVPNKTYDDTGEVKIDRFTIRNSDLKANGIQTMTQVLEKSLNTGMIYVMRQMGGEVMSRYLKEFGFGELIGVQLDTEVAGDIVSLDRGHEIYYATNSYGQGLTVTPLQMVQAYTALANGGRMMKPYLVQEVRHANGEVEVTEPVQLRQVISQKTAQTITAMLVSVVENGHAGSAGVNGYYIAGKTGTAQVARENGAGYKPDETIASFVGYGPARDPQFVMLVRLDHPKTSPWASGTAAPTFGEIADFLLQYEQIPPER